MGTILQSMDMPPRESFAMVLAALGFIGTVATTCVGWFIRLAINRAIRQVDQLQADHDALDEEFQDHRRWVRTTLYIAGVVKDPAFNPFRD